MRDTRKLDQLVDVAELRITGNDGRRALVVTVIENTADADIVVRLLFERPDQRFGIGAAADDYGAALHGAIAGPAADFPSDDQAGNQDDGNGADRPDEKPAAREMG